MAQAIVDLLESVHVSEHHPEPVAGSEGQPELLLRQRDESAAVEQAGELVGDGQSSDRLDHVVAFRHVADHDHKLRFAEGDDASLEMPGRIGAGQRVLADREATLRGGAPQRLPQETRDVGRHELIQGASNDPSVRRNRVFERAGLDVVDGAIVRDERDDVGKCGHDAAQLGSVVARSASRAVSSRRNARAFPRASVHTLASGSARSR